MASFWESIRLNSRVIIFFLNISHLLTLSDAGIRLSLARKYLISWWFQPTFEKICSSKWESFPQIFEGEKNKDLSCQLPPPRLF